MSKPITPAEVAASKQALLPPAAEKAVVEAAMDFRTSILSCRKHLGPYRAPFDKACDTLERKRNLT